MISIESIKYSLKNLWQRKARSMFTILSIFVGITTIFIFISFGWGLYKYVEDVSSGSSADKILVQPKGSSAPGLNTAFKLTDKDVKAIERTIGVYEASGVYIQPALVTQDKKSIYAFMMGYDPKKPLILETYTLGINKGRALMKGENGKVVLGYNYQIPDRIFPKPFKVGDKIEIQGQKLRIIGFYDEVGNPQDDSNIYVINDFIQQIYPDTTLTYAMIVGKVDVNNINAVIDRVEKNLRKERGLTEGNEDFYVTSYDDLLNSYMSALNIIVGFVVLIALISVAVSAVNTANTMITSVLERVKEIGIIKSIGARNSEVFKIFLFESSFLGFVSGIIGVLVGWAITSTAGRILAGLGWGFLRPYNPWILFAGLILFATATGGVSGVFPAYQASKMKPVDALRYE